MTTILIDRDVWIASSNTLLKGVTIRNGAVVAANSAVNNNVEGYHIIAGSLIRNIGERV